MCVATHMASGAQGRPPTGSRPAGIPAPGLRPAPAPAVCRPRRAMHAPSSGQRMGVGRCRPPGSTPCAGWIACLALLPPHVKTNLDETVLDYWLKRVEQHTQDSYAGIPLSKFPEDLRVYEHLLWESKPNAVIELGAQLGGSALWFTGSIAHVDWLHVSGRLSSHLARPGYVCSAGKPRRRRPGLRGNDRPCRR